MEVAALENYSKHVESLYQEVRSFRHDYANVLMSLKAGIDQGDLDNIKKFTKKSQLTQQSWSKTISLT